jgi:peptidoglycan/LPS O-acetylase OafA/YrhL
MLFSGKAIAEYFPIWLLGWLAYNYRGSLKPLAVVPATVALFVCLVLSRRNGLTGSLLTDYPIAIACAWVVTAISGFRSDATRMPKGYQFFSRSSSAISYSLYLLHVPMLFFINAIVIGGKERWQPNVPFLGLGSAVALATLVYVIIVWRQTEFNTPRLRRFLARLSNADRKPFVGVSSPR